VLLGQRPNLLLLRVGQIHAAKRQPGTAATADSGACLAAPPASTRLLVLRECDARSERPSEHGDKCVYTKIIHLGLPPALCGPADSLDDPRYGSRTAKM
jgi:hypothetical protein